MRTKCGVYLVAFLIAGSFSFAQITTPEKYLGYRPGADFHLATYEQLIGYLELLDQQSAKLKVFDMGPTSEGRRMKYAVISSEENMADLEKYKDIVRKLSLAQTADEKEARQLAQQGKAVVWIDSGIHADETSGPMHQFQLAYELVTGEDDQIKNIRANTILLLVCANPDGMTMVADWYMKNVGTKYETSRLPFLYQKYAGHDNNRDGFMANLLETQNINRVVGCQWYPEIMYAQHESAPFPARIWMPPNPEPVNPNLHPLIFRWKNLIGSAMGQAFDEHNQPGAISRTAFDLWYPGYLDGPSVEGHHIPSILTETANFGYATPRFYSLGDFSEAYRDLTKGTFYPSPWEGGWWRLSDAVAYSLTASKAVLDVAAKYRTELLYSKYKMAKDVMDKYKSEPPYGWIIPAEQKDHFSTTLLLNRLILFGIEVYQTEEDFDQDGLKHDRGAYVIPAGQPFGLYVKNLFEKQNYPDLRLYPHLWQGIASGRKIEGAPLAPYDGVGWTLPKQMGVDLKEITKPFHLKKTLIKEAFPPKGSVGGTGEYYAFTPQDNNSFLGVNRILKAGGKLFRADDEFRSSDRTFPRGTFLLEKSSLTGAKLKEIAESENIRLTGVGSSVKHQKVKNNRIALYQSWSAGADMGWLRLVLDQFHFEYRLVTNAEIKSGSLKSRFDVIILPDQNAASIINGRPQGTIHPDYVGGITLDGVARLKEFVEEGGTLICHKTACELPLQHFLLPVKNILAGVQSDRFNCPGSLLKIDFAPNEPLAYGFDKTGIGYFSGALAFDVISDPAPTKVGPRIIASYSSENLLISGWAIGEDLIKKKAAVVEVPFEKGNIILFGFSIHNRVQSYSTLKLLFNAIYK